VKRLIDMMTTQRSQRSGAFHVQLWSGHLGGSTTRKHGRIVSRCLQFLSEFLPRASTRDKSRDVARLRRQEAIHYRDRLSRTVHLEEQARLVKVDRAKRRIHSARVPEIIQRPTQVSVDAMNFAALQVESGSSRVLRETRVEFPEPDLDGSVGICPRRS
jgi:hypothetical protein